MTLSVLDPAPRTYAENIFLLVRSSRGPACAPRDQSIQDVVDWLLHEAARIDDVILMFEEFLWRCSAVGIPVNRATLHIGTLHPRMVGFSWVWSSLDGICDEIAASVEALDHDSYKNSPLYRVINNGETIEVDLENPADVGTFPLMPELAAQGYTSYAAMPLSSTSKMNNAMTFATTMPGGFDKNKHDGAQQLLNLFALHVERHIVQRIARNVADTYLGPIAGQRVLSGEIRRGDGEAIEAVVLMADMRGFTKLADRLSGPEVTAILNAYFDRISSAVIGHGGDILKFMGDGVLAVFDQKALGEHAAAEAAVKAARAALAAIDELNENPPRHLPDQIHWHPLKIGIGLHRGEVFFGNVGGEERLDFTVIGRAVNETSRVEALCKPLDRTLLLTEPVRAALSKDVQADLSAMGNHALRGVGQPVAIFAGEASAASLQ
ncbi:MAG: adenylate/guanylate cyclase domain-containing protein [Roseibium sp.]